MILSDAAAWVLMTTMAVVIGVVLMMEAYGSKNDD